MLDSIVDRPQLRDLLSILLDLLPSQYKLKARRKTHKQHSDIPKTQAWDSVQLARHKARPTALDYIGRMLTNFVEIHGDRSHGDDGAIICGLGDFGGQTVVVIGQERGRSGDPVDRNDGRTTPEGFRKAQRAIQLAIKFDVPLITLVDTPGPDPSLDAEERGLGNVIASTMSKMSGIKVPSIAVVIGEGGSEAALALGVANTVLMMEKAIYSIISPEEAAGLIFQDETRANEIAESLKLTAQDCYQLGIIDQIVQEPTGGAHTNPDAAARQLRRVLLQELSELQSMSPRRLMNHRYKKFRKMGEYGSHFKTLITREISSLQGLVSIGVKSLSKRHDRQRTPPKTIGENKDNTS